MADLNYTAGRVCVQKAICTICFEDLKPIIEDLQALPNCGHVFHELCIQQWLEYCPAGKVPTCPVCKQSCSPHSPTRLYFQSTSDSTHLSSSTQDSANTNAEMLAEEVRKLEMKLKKADDELCAWKQLAKREELRTVEIKKEKDFTEQLLYLKMEELSMKTVEIAKLQERTMALAKELAALKLATDMNLEEEDIVKLASIGHGSNTNALDVLKKSLALRNKSYKDLMIQCNILGRSETRACKKLDMAIKKINKLKIRLQEMEKTLEEKENEFLRDLKVSNKFKQQVNLSYSVQSVSCPTMEDQAVKQSEMENSNLIMVRQYVTEKSNHITLGSCDDLDQFCRSERTNLKKTSSLVHEESNHAVDRIMDSYNFIDVDNLSLVSDSNGHPTLAVKCENGRSYQGSAYCMFGDDSKDDEEGSPVVIRKKVRHHNISMITADKILMDGLQKGPNDADKDEAQACVSPAGLGNPYFSGSLVPGGVNRNTSKLSKHIQSMSSSGDLIVVGADGRGGRTKILKARDECLGRSVMTIGSKRQKHGAKLRSQFNIEHFFEKAQSGEK